MAGWVQLAVLIAILAIAYRPLGDYMAWALNGKRSLRVERFIYRLAGVNPDVQQRWTAYATSVLAFSLLSVLVLYLLLRVQGSLPLSLGFRGVAPDHAFHTAV
ncbi:MAG TPA: potassium-transporting ATPase subunit KdpA, partial [Actinomycetota bacterium]|nr:potassium-transporting ATPase subunit KdpA [Actinomycetota bacterium]